MLTFPKRNRNGRKEPKDRSTKASRRRQAHAPSVEGVDSRAVNEKVLQAFSPDEQSSALRHMAEDQPEVFENERAPYFPTVDEAVDTNKEAHALYGQKAWGGVLKPNELDSAIHAGKQHYYYGPEEDEAERLAVSAAKIGWRMAGSQIFVDGNKRTALHTTRHFLDQNGLGHIAPLTHDDVELGDKLIAQDRYQTEEKAPEALAAERARLENEYIELFRNRYFQGGPQAVEGCQCGHCIGEPYQQIYPEGSYLINPQHEGRIHSNILDPIHDELDPTVWAEPDANEPHLRPEHLTFIHEFVYKVLKGAGYTDMEIWLSLVLTGSLTTYQYSPQSDCDISLFVDAEKFPEWSRAEMIGLMVEKCDGTKLAGTTHDMQCFVVARGMAKTDLYKPGLRSAYDLQTQTWIVPPERDRVHDVEKEMNEAYTIALESADKMERLLRYEPDKAVMFWHQIHKRRMRDQKGGRGDYAPSNIVYKFLANRGLFPAISEVSGEYIA